MYVCVVSCLVVDVEVVFFFLYRIFVVFFVVFWWIVYGVFGSGLVCGGFFVEVWFDEDV